MDLPTYTNIWRIEKRLYKLYDLRLPMPLPLVQIGVFLGVFVPWIVLLKLVGIPFQGGWILALYVVPPGILTWMATRPVIEGKRLTELLLSQSRYLVEPRTWCRLTPIREPREVVVVVKVWRRPGDATSSVAAAVRSDRRARKAQRGRRGAPVRVTTHPAAMPGAGLGPSYASAPQPLSAQLAGLDATAGAVVTPVPALPEPQLPVPAARAADLEPVPVPVRAQMTHRWPPPDPRERASGPDPTTQDRTLPAPESARQVERPPVKPVLEAQTLRPPAGPLPGPRVRERATSSGGPGEPVTASAQEQPGNADRTAPVDPAETQGSGKRALASGVRRPGAAAEFWKAIAPEDDAAPAPQAVEPASADAMEPVPVEPIPVEPGSVEPGSVEHGSVEPGSAEPEILGTVPAGQEEAQQVEPTPVRAEGPDPVPATPAPAESPEQTPAPRAPTTRPDIPQVPAATRPDIPMVPGAFGAGRRAPLQRPPAADRPVAGQSAAEGPAVARPMAERPGAEQPAAGRPGVRQPAAEQPAAEQPSAGLPAAQRPAAEQPVSERSPVKEPVAPPRSTERPQRPQTPTTDPGPQAVGAEPQVAGLGSGEAAAGPPPWSKNLARPMQEGQTDALVWPPSGHRRRMGPPRQQQAPPESPETPVTPTDRPGTPPAQIPQDAPAATTPAPTVPAEVKPPVSPPPAQPPVLPRPAARPLPPVQPAASASEPAPGVRKAPPAQDRRTWPAQPPVRGIPPRPQGTPIKPPPPEVVPEVRQPVTRPRQAPQPRAVPAAEVQPSPSTEVRSGPASPVRPRPRPLIPPTPPPPPAATITPPDMEQEGTAGGLRRLIQAVGGGHSDLDAEYEERLQRPFQGTRHIVVLGCTGGAGQTVTALMLGHTFAQYCGEPIVAIDVNPGPGALARRTRSETPETLTGLIARADQVHSLTAMRRYTSQAKSGLDVIAAGKNPLQALDDRDYALAIRTLDRFYSVTMLDAAAAVVARVLPHADQIVLVAPASADAPRAVGMTFEWLDGHGYDGLRSRAVTVINGVSRRSMDDVEQAEAVARGQCRALVRIPWDDHLSLDRSPRNELKALRAPTRRAYLALAGVVAGGFAALPERYQEHEQEVGR